MPPVRADRGSLNTVLAEHSGLVSGGAAFDAEALMRALRAERARRELDWVGVAGQITAQSAVLRERMHDHAVCGGALIRTVERQTMTCQYALMLLRWLDRAPEDFLTGEPAHRGDTTLPEADSDHRLLFDLPALWSALNERRRADGSTWTSLARDLECSAAQLTNLRTARQADMHLVIRTTQHLGLPAARFIHAVDT